MKAKIIPASSGVYVLEFPNTEGVVHRMPVIGWRIVLSTNPRDEDQISECEPVCPEPLGLVWCLEYPDGHEGFIWSFQDGEKFSVRTNAIEHGCAILESEQYAQKIARQKREEMDRKKP